MPEIRILIDAVNAASFITPKKTVELVGKVAALGGSHRGEIMKSETKIYNTTKHSNEYIYYNINEIELAITLKKKASFYYFDYNEKKEKAWIAVSSRSSSGQERMGHRLKARPL